MSGSVSSLKTVQGNSVRILHEEKKRLRLFLLIGGILLIGYGLFQGKAVPTSNQSTGIQTEVSSFSQEPVVVDKKLLEPIAPKGKPKSPPVRIIIPAIDIDIPIKEAKIVKGYWEVFPDTTGFGLGSAYPDEVGNQVVFAHARKGLFLPLKNAKVGQIVYILTKEKWYSYKIDEIKEVLPSQTEVIAPTLDTVLTLYTCSGFDDSKRLIVKAVKVN